MPATRTPARADAVPRRTATPRTTPTARTAPTARSRAAGAPRAGGAPRGAGRPPLTPAQAAALREARALREALALRQAAARAGVSPEQLAAAQAAVEARRPAGGRSRGSRTATRRPAAGRRAARRAPVRRRSRSASSGERTGSRWSTRLGVVATSALLLPVVLALAVPVPQQPGGPADPVTLALTARSSLLEQTDLYRELAREVDSRRARLQQAEAAAQAARDEVADQQRSVGDTAAELYRSAPADRLPVFGLDVRNARALPGVLHRQALSDRSERERERTVVRAERSAASLDAADARVAAARTALADAEERAAGVLDTVRAHADDLSPEVSGLLAGIGTIPTAGEQQARNDAAMRRWQTYLAGLAAAGIEPPSAAELTDPAVLPSGLSAALDADGRPVPGVAWAVVGSRPVTVLPAETVVAVSNALSQLGKPFVPGTTGPETYDCGGYTAASWLMGGYALPGTPQAQWAAGAAVPLRDLQVGDLVFSPGGADVGIYLGDGDVAGASAATYQVGVRSMAPGSTAVRVPVAGPAAPNAPLPAERAGDCGAPLPAPGPVNPAWGGWQNGRIPVEALCRLGVDGHALRCDAAASYGALAAAYTAAFGTPLCITDSYRSFGAQVGAYHRKPALAAVPGTSNHGWALAVDLCAGVNVAGTPQWTWMTANAARFGFVQPDWARPGGEKPEPWHWEYGVIS